VCLVKGCCGAVWVIAGVSESWAQTDDVVVMELLRQIGRATIRRDGMKVLLYSEIVGWRVGGKAARVRYLGVPKSQDAWGRLKCECRGGQNGAVTRESKGCNWGVCVGRGP
jgi:hypothetical protein